MPHALDVVGQLMLEMGGSSARVEARDDTIVVELPGLRDGLAILKGQPGGRERRRAILQIHQALTGAGLRLEARVGPRTVALLGVGARAGLISRLLGVAPLEIRAGGLIGRGRPADGRSER